MPPEGLGKLQTILVQAGAIHQQNQSLADWASDVGGRLAGGSQRAMETALLKALEALDARPTAAMVQGFKIASAPMLQKTVPPLQAALSGSSCTFSTASLVRQQQR